MLVIGRRDDTGPTALKGSLAIYPWGVAPGWYEPGPSALLKGLTRYSRGGCTIAAPRRAKAKQQDDAFPLMALG